MGAFQVPAGIPAAPVAPVGVWSASLGRLPSRGHTKPHAWQAGVGTAGASRMRITVFCISWLLVPSCFTPSSHTFSLLTPRQQMPSQILPLLP